MHFPSCRQHAHPTIEQKVRLPRSAEPLLPLNPHTISHLPPHGLPADRREAIKFIKIISFPGYSPEQGENFLGFSFPRFLAVYKGIFDNFYFFLKNCQRTKIASCDLTYPPISCEPVI
jgi:hypothetical protein